MTQPRILVCTPIVTGVGPKAYFSHINMWKHVGRSTSYGAVPAVVGPRRSPRKIRNKAAQEAIEMGFSHLFFLDDDIVDPPTIIDILLQADKPVVGALLHNSEGEPLVWKGNTFGEEIWRDHPSEPLFKCWAVALGAMMINVDVLRQMAQPARGIPPWFWFDKTERTMDVNFCRSIQDRGQNMVWCSTVAACQQIVHDERVR